MIMHAGLRCRGSRLFAIASYFLASCEISKISHTLRMIKSSYSYNIYFTHAVDKQLLNDVH